MVSRQLLNGKSIYENEGAKALKDPFMATKKCLSKLIMFGILILALLKLMTVVFLSPLMGYANNWDFIRQSSCVGVWQFHPEIPKTSKYVDAPVNPLIFDGEKLPFFCLKSIDNVFPYLATLFHRVGDPIDFRAISFFKVSALLAGLFLILVYALNYAQKIAITIAFFLVFGDMFTLLYINTLYLEFSVIAALFLLIPMTAILLSSREPPRLPVLILFLLSILWLGLTKQQYSPLAPVTALTAAFVFWYHWRGYSYAAIFFMVALAIPLLFAQMNKDIGIMNAINFANKTNTYLGAVLPEAQDKEAALVRLGLPNHCLAGVGKTWYTPGMQENHLCPEVKDSSRIRLLGLFFEQPVTLYEPLYMASQQLHPFYPEYLGYLEEPGIENTRRYQFAKSLNFTRVIGSLGANTGVWLLVSGSALALIAIMVLLGGGVHSATKTLYQARFGLWLIALGGSVMFYSVFSSIFGDGYAEIPRHAVGFTVGLAFQVSGLINFLSLKS